MPPSAIVTKLTLADFQRQYGTMWRAAERYLDGQMPIEQAASFEQVVNFALVQSVAMTRVVRALAGQ